VKAGDLVRCARSGGKDPILGLFLGWRTFDKKSNNQYTCPEILWLKDNKIGTIQASLLEVISESR